jgi:asparagine synthase (glutamine-hydrolysing)
MLAPIASLVVEDLSVCGVAGYLFRSRDGLTGDSLVREMLRELVHRGPDAEGVAILGGAGLGVGLGCRRLAIVDPSERSNQPIINERGSIHLVHNGEIYNYRELRRELESRGHVFRSAGDAEVIGHAYEEWGAACVKRFNGEWAFALWDAATRRLFCSRDRFGIKPFYYAEEPEQFVFASEIKALSLSLFDCRDMILEARHDQDRFSLSDFGGRHRWRIEFGTG